MKTSCSFTPVAQQMTDAVVITDAQDRVEWINQAFTRMCGYTLKDLKGQKPGALLQGPETDPEAARMLNQAIRRGRPVSVELVNYHKKKWPYSVWISLTPIKTRDGKITGFVSIERETTALQHELRKRENDIAHLYDVICHLATGNPA